MNFDDITQQQIASILRSTQGTRDDPYQLPGPIFDELEQLGEKECSSLVNRFPKALLHYEGQQWTQCGAINGIFLEKLKKFKMDGKSIVQAKYKDGERIRAAARAATELFEEVSSIMENLEQATIIEDLDAIKEKLKQLAIYSFATAKTIDTDAKAVAERALGLHNDRSIIDRDLAFSTEEVEKIQKRLYEQRITTMATRNNQGNGFRGGRGYGRGRNFRSSPHRYTNKWGNKFQSTNTEPTTTSNFSNTQ